MPPANYAKGATTTRPSNLADTYYNTYTANTGVTLNRSYTMFTIFARLHTAEVMRIAI